MDRRFYRWAVAGSLLALLAPGCCSPYHTDQGALFGGVTGAGVGALVGSTVGRPGAGAAIGAGVGALTGAAVGAGMDEAEARNRALIEQQMGRQLAAGAANINDVISMTRAGVNEESIIRHVQYHGMAVPLQANDLIVLKQQGVSDRVVQIMQSTGPQPMPGYVQPMYAQPAYVQPAPVVVEETWGPGPYWHHPHRYYPPGPPPGVTWGVSIRN